MNLVIWSYIATKLGLVPLSSPAWASRHATVTVVLLYGLGYNHSGKLLNFPLALRPSLGSMAALRAAHQVVVDYVMVNYYDFGDDSLQLLSPPLFT